MPKGYFPYKHRNLREAYASLKYYMTYLFTFEKHAEINIKNTTNRLEGLFKYLKRQLNHHNGLTKKRKVMVCPQKFRLLFKGLLSILY